MPTPTFIIVYVADAEASAAFYAGLLGRPPVQVTPELAMVALDPALTLWVWAHPGDRLLRA